MQSYYTLRQDGSTATVYIYGDITADDDNDGGVCASSIVRQIETIDADTIHVHIDSYGGAVSEGWAIYNALLPASCENQYLRRRIRRFGRIISVFGR